MALQVGGGGAQEVDPETLRAIEVAAEAEYAEQEREMRESGRQAELAHLHQLRQQRAAEQALQIQNAGVGQLPQLAQARVIHYQRNLAFRGVPQGAGAADEMIIQRIQYMQQAMVTMMFSLLAAMMAKYVHQIEIKKKESVEEKQFVETMFSLYSIQWMFATIINFLLASDPSLTGSWSFQIFDFLIGASCGVFAVQLIEYIRGFFFVDSQEESDFIHLTAIGILVVGAITWSMVCYVVMLILREVGTRREHAQRRVNLVNRMQGIPYANLAFNVDHTCSICFESFKNEDEVLQLPCHNSHIFHQDCIKEWVRTSTAQCPLCKQEINL